MARGDRYRGPLRGGRPRYRIRRGAPSRGRSLGLTQTRFTPRIADTAKALLVIYLTLTLAEVLALLLAGMNLYDSVAHTFATVTTGGFSPTKTASVGFYDSVAIEAVIGVFMVLSGVSF